jgi:hypothetical protein
MARKHAFVLAIVLGLAATVGAVAAVTTARLGQPQANAPTIASQNAALRTRTRLLDRQEAALRRALTKRPPRLPNVPRFAPVSAPARSAQAASAPAPVAAAAAAPRVQYVRPAPIVIVKHHPHGDDGHEQEQGGGGGGDD